ncbi:hypothetical protein JRQ81_008254 [Phrynocephalus forsythii]|uniref:RING-type domain-containing protein n=1 Tax=Phrynocephalus forsythii TaxID=171643 RepID=A0A9Q0XDH1_9SAUR|nr:hypothetical protein JRQ81_008254 [Phrynocephalus forsythii]
MGVVNNNREAHVKIEVKEMPAWPDYDVWILLTLLSTGLIIASIFIVRTRCQPSRSQTNVREGTLQAISRLATRRYQARPRAAPAADSVSSCSSAPVCAICLEEFSEGQELRIITCLHEFHRQCVDPWLQEHQTCPLCMFNIMEHISSASPLYPLEDPPLRGPGGRPRFFRQHPGRAFYRLPPVAATNCSAALPRGHPFFHSPELSQLDFGTMHYLPYRPVTPDPWCGHQPPLARSLLASQPQEPAGREPALPPRRPCLLAHRFPCRALRVPLAAKLSRGVPLQRGLRHGRHQHYQHYHHHAHSSGSGEMYRTEPSGYLPDGPGSDSSSGPCHGSSSDSVLNCTDASLQAIHGSCSTFHSSLSSDYDPFAFGGTERLASGNGRELPASRRDPRPHSSTRGRPASAATSTTTTTTTTGTTTTDAAPRTIPPAGRAKTRICAGRGIPGAEPGPWPPEPSCKKGRRRCWGKMAPRPPRTPLGSGGPPIYVEESQGALYPRDLEAVEPRRTKRQPLGRGRHKTRACKSIPVAGDGKAPTNLLFSLHAPLWPKMSVFLALPVQVPGPAAPRRFSHCWAPVLLSFLPQPWPKSPRPWRDTLSWSLRRRETLVWAERTASPWLLANVRGQRPWRPMAAFPSTAHLGNTFRDPTTTMPQMCLNIPYDRLWVCRPCLGQPRRTDRLANQGG